MTFGVSAGADIHQVFIVLEVDRVENRVELTAAEDTLRSLGPWGHRILRLIQVIQVVDPSEFEVFIREIVIGKQG